MYYASPKHEKLYRNVIRGRDHPSETLATLYLLTAKRKLWLRWCRSVSNRGIDWQAGRSIEPDWDGFYRATRSHTNTTPLNKILRAFSPCSAKSGGPLLRQRQQLIFRGVE